MPEILGYTSYGTGPNPVLVLHDWFCDHSSWDATLPYLTTDRFTYVFADLRGYGTSRAIEGEYSLEEAARDVVALAGRLEWNRFSLIGHSMSGLIVQRVAQLIPDRIARLVAVTPVAPAGMGADDATLDFFRSIALADDEARFSMLSPLWGTRLSETWIRQKVRRWRETASPAAAAKYVELWGRSGILPVSGAAPPMLIVAGAEDAPPFRAAALEASMLPHYPHARLISLSQSGHYPMQEQPPLLATEIERFLTADQC